MCGAARFGGDVMWCGGCSSTVESGRDSRCYGADSVGIGWVVRMIRAQKGNFAVESWGGGELVVARVSVGDGL